MNYISNAEIFESCDMAVWLSLFFLVKMILEKCSQTIFKIKQETNLKVVSVLSFIILHNCIHKLWLP